MVKNASHTLAYSFIGLQELNLAHRFPVLYWDCACLIADSGNDDEEDDIVEIDTDIEDTEDDIDEPAEEKTAEKSKPVNYDKVAKALGKIIQAGIAVDPPNINLSDYTFKPDIKRNSIVYGLHGITRIGTDVIRKIIANRPYESIPDFLAKVKVNKTQMVNLIKSGAFDCLMPRETAMLEYLNFIKDTKTNLTIVNVPMLRQYNLIPEELEFPAKVYNFHRYIIKNKRENGRAYELDERAMSFYQTYYNMDYIYYDENNKAFIKAADWKRIQDAEMKPLRAWLQNDKTNILEKLNIKLLEELYDKYASGTISKWEMDSISYYSHEHELAHVSTNFYGISDFFTLPEEPQVARIANVKGQEVPIYKIHRFAGTVLGKNKTKGIVTLLTTTGVVSVRIYKNQFTEYDKRISVLDPTTGKKKIIENSWFTRGNKLLVTGYRRGEDVVLKKYKETPYPLISLITDIGKDGTIRYVSQRADV